MTANRENPLNEIIRHVGDGQWTVNLSKDVYEKAAIFATGYKFNTQCSVHIEPDAQENWLVTLLTDNEAVDGHHVVTEFLKEIVDQQCRQDLQKQFGHLRDLIVEQAFKPVARLKDKIK